MKTTTEITEAANNLLDELDLFVCACSTKEIVSGHRTTCRMPWVNEAASKLREAISKAEDA